MLCIEHYRTSNKPGGSGGSVESNGTNFGCRFIAFLGHAWQQLQNAPGGKETNDRKRNKTKQDSTSKQTNKIRTNTNKEQQHPETTSVGFGMRVPLC